jgi:hypothetical protein
MANVILSYRRLDTGALTGRVFDRLAARYGRDAVFRDLESIPVGIDFRAHIADAVRKCDVLVAMIGPKWLGRSGKGLKAKIHNNDDLVRVEIETALAAKIPIIPVLAAGTRMPNASQLPASLADFVFRNGDAAHDPCSLPVPSVVIAARLDWAQPNHARCRDSSGTVFNGTILTLISLALPRGLEPLFSP